MKFYSRLLEDRKLSKQLSRTFFNQYLFEMTALAGQAEGVAPFQSEERSCFTEYATRLSGQALRAELQSSDFVSQFRAVLVIVLS